MARLSVYFNLLVIVLSVITASTYGDPTHPTYSECKPLIDATIMDLAAKAVHAGEQPSSSGDESKPCPRVEATQTEGIQNWREETHSEPTPEPQTSPEQLGGYEAEGERGEQASPGYAEQTLTPSPPPAEAPAPPPPAEVPAYQAPPPPPPAYQAPPPPAYQAPPPPAYQAPPPPAYQAPPPPTYQAPSPPQAAAPPMEEIGLFDKFINKVFGLPKEVARDPKYAEPWTTHPEFKKKEKPPGETSKKVSTEPGAFSNFVNKLVDKIFQLPEGQRDPKFAQPWQTHPEHIKKVVDTPAKPKEPGKSFISFEFVNKFVALIFGKDTTGPRDPKWAQPWTTHPEHAKTKVKEVPSGERPKAVVQTKGGMINSFVSLFFEIPKGERDSKWSKPWQTHEEHKKSQQKGSDKAEIKQLQPAAPGVISKTINKFIYKLFGESSGERDPKYAQPWQTHEQFKKSKEPEKKPAEKSDLMDFLGLRRMINKFVATIFGKVEGERDPKWAQPWQTHEKPFASQRPSAPKVTPEQRTTTQIPQAAPAPPPTPVPQAAPAPPPTPAPPAAPAPPPTPIPQAAPPPPPTPAPPAAPAPPPPTPVPQAAPAPPPTPAPQAAPAPPPTPAPQAAPAPLPTPAPAPKPTPQDAPAPPPLKVEPEKPIQEKPGPSKVEEEPEKEKKPHREEEEEEPFPSDSRDGSKAEAKADPGRMASTPETPVKQVLEDVEPKKEQKKEKIIEDEEQIVVVPSAFRPRDHIESILGLDEAASLSSARTDPIAESTLKDLKKIYEDAVKPLEVTYKYQDISNRQMSDAELFGTPLVLLLGPYSTGKSTFINYLLGTEFTRRALKTGTPPSHGVFRIVKYGNQDRDLDGTDLSGHWSFGSLQKFGQNFVDQVYGKEINSPLLKKVTFVEAPGILEMRRPGERIYPFNDVVQWFIDRADLILIMFDYTKLDAGYEMEAILDQLKGRESQTRILLNKADQVPPEELIKVQGSLFWNLSPLLGVSSPPTVYAGSFASLPYRTGSPAKLFQAQEEALLHDIAKAIYSRVDNRIAIVRRHAVRVRNHAQMVDTYLSTFYKNKGFLTSKHKLADEIIENPHAYNIYEGISLLTNISRYDLPDAEIYRDFFRIHNLYSFKTLRETCTYLAGCPLDKLDAAISKKLPELMTKYRRLVEAAAPGARLPEANIRPSGMGGANVAHAHHSKS